MNERPLVAIARGGYSGEAIVSMGSAQQMMDAVDHKSYDCAFLTISEEVWSASDKAGNPLDLDRGNLLIDGRKVSAVLVAIHGTPGEDGLLQGYLEMLGVPYQTGDVLNMSLTFSKYSTTAVLRQFGFNVADSILINSHEAVNKEELLKRIGTPCFVKPDRSGSSLGISKVNSASELDDALKLAFAECPMVMVEECITGRELTCGLIRMKGETKALPICEVKTEKEYFDYDAKYHDEGTQEIVPAEIPENVEKLCKERSLAIFDALGCRGMARIDYFWTGKELLTIEVNTVPGFSAKSIVPKMLQVDGMGVEQAINGLIEEMLT